MAHVLDDAAGISLPSSIRFDTVYPKSGYGFGLACLVRKETAHYGWRLLAAVVRGLRVRLFGR